MKCVRTQLIVCVISNLLPSGLTGLQIFVKTFTKLLNWLWKGHYNHNFGVNFNKNNWTPVGACAYHTRWLWLFETFWPQRFCYSLEFFHIQDKQWDRSTGSDKNIGHFILDFPANSTCDKIVEIHQPMYNNISHEELVNDLPKVSLSEIQN